MEQLFRQEAIDHRKGRLLGTISLMQPPSFKYFTLLILILVITSIIVLSLGSYKKKETVTGIIQPDSGILKLRAPQSGIVYDLLVHEGQEVRKDQPILRIQTEKHGTKGFELNQSKINLYEFQIDSFELQLAKQKGKHKLEIKSLNYKHENLVKRLKQLVKQNEIHKERIAINQKITEQIRILKGTGYISELENNKQKDSSLSLEQERYSFNSEKLLIENQIKQINSQLLLLPITQAKEDDLIETKLIQLHALRDAIKQQKLGELRAPTDGVVTGLLTKTGKSVNTHQYLLSIIPKGSVMQAVIYVPTSAIGFIEESQITMLRYHAFPYQRFGVYEGHISEVSVSVILPDETVIPGLITVPSYRIVVALPAQSVQAYGKIMPLRSGMKLDADIVIEHHSLIRWIFDPLFSIKEKL